MRTTTTQDDKVIPTGMCRPCYAGDTIKINKLIMNKFQYSAPSLYHQLLDKLKFWWYARAAIISRKKSIWKTMQLVVIRQNYIKVQARILLCQTHVSSIKESSVTLIYKIMQIQNQFRSLRAYKPKIYRKSEGKEGWYNNCIYQVFFVQLNTKI